MRNRVGLFRRQHGLEVRVKKTIKIGGEIVIVGILAGRGCVWLRNADEFGRRCLSVMVEGCRLHGHERDRLWLHGWENGVFLELVRWRQGGC